MPKAAKSPKKKPRGIDRMIPGNKRITIRGERIKGIRNQLDCAITRALQLGEVDALRKLGARIDYLGTLVADRDA